MLYITCILILVGRTVLYSPPIDKYIKSFSYKIQNCNLDPLPPKKNKHFFSLHSYFTLSISASLLIFTLLLCASSDIILIVIKFINCTKQLFHFYCNLLSFISFHLVFKCCLCFWLNTEHKSI